MLAHALLLLLVAGGAAQLACNNEGPRNDCGYVGITQQQCNAKSRVSIPLHVALTQSRLLLEPCQPGPLVLLLQRRCLPDLQGAWVPRGASPSDRLQINSVAATANGLTASLGIISQGPSLYGADVNPLQVRPSDPSSTSLCSLRL